MFHVFLQYILKLWGLNIFCLRKQHGELNCLQWNNTGHLRAPELFCRLRGWTVECTLPLMPCPLIFPVTTAPHRNPHNLCRRVLLGTPHFKGAYLLLEIWKVQMWMHPPTSINDGAGPPDPPLLANKVLLRFGGFSGSLMGLVRTSTLIYFHCMCSPNWSLWFTKFQTEKWRYLFCARFFISSINQI